MKVVRAVYRLRFRPSATVVLVVYIHAHSAKSILSTKVVVRERAKHINGIRIHYNKYAEI